MSLITASTSIQTNNIDTIAGTTTLNLGGTNATTIALNETVTANGTLGVSGITTASGGLNVNTINPLSDSNDMTIGATLGPDKKITIGKTAGPMSGFGLPVEFPRGVYTDANYGVKSIKLNSNDPTLSLLIGDQDTSTAGIYIGNPIHPTGQNTTVFGKLTPTEIDCQTFDYVGGSMFIGFDATSVKLSVKNDPTEVLPFQSTVEVSSTLTSNTINFHSNAEFDPDYDSRIVATGGSASDGQGTLQLDTKSLQLTINGGNGAVGEVLTSDGTYATWSPASGGVSFANGSITSITNSALTSYTFPTPILKTASPNAPLILLTGENGGTSFIVQLSVGTVSGNATQWTGFSYITSGVGLNKINWIAINQ